MPGARQAWTHLSQTRLFSFAGSVGEPLETIPQELPENLRRSQRVRPIGKLMLRLFAAIQDELYRQYLRVEAPCPIHFAGFIAKWVGGLHTI